jgi:threonine dehydrogenase-like Zn-dependent dehydrogenase
VAALAHVAAPGSLLVGAKYAHQHRLAEELGADVVVDPDQLVRAVRRSSRSLEGSATLTGGADVVVDCVGSEESLAQALSMVRPRGRVVLVGMPGRVTVDLASLWHREVAVTGAYAYGNEDIGGVVRRTFDVAMELVAAKGLGRLVSARYPLDRFEEALAHAGAAGRRGAVKVVFDLRARERHRATDPITKGPVS